MKRHKLVQHILILALGVALVLAMALCRLGLAPLHAGLIAMNAAALLLYGYDKRQAIVGGTRIPETVLHAVALLGGSPGALLGQGLFRHKTRKRRFRLVFAVIVLLQAGLIYGYWRYLR